MWRHLVLRAFIVDVYHVHFLVDMCTFGCGRRGRIRCVTTSPELQQLQSKCDADIRPRNHRLPRCTPVRLETAWTDELVHALYHFFPSTMLPVD